MSESIAPTPTRSSSPWGSVFRSTTFYVLCAVIALVAIFTVATGGSFLDPGNLQSIGRNSAGLLLLAVGLTFVLGAGHIDLSVGSTLVLASIVSAQTIVALTSGTSPVFGPAQVWIAYGIGAIVAVVVGLIAGIANGVLVVKLRINSFVVTLGTMGIILGIAQVITNGSNVSGLPVSIQTGFGVVNWVGVPVSLLAAVVIAILAAILLTQTAFGNHALAIGSSRTSAQRAGVNVARTTLGVFVVAGFMAGAAGFLDITRFATTALSGHGNDILQALSAVIIGGTSLFGGRASVAGSSVATFIPAVLLAGFVGLGVSSFYQGIAIGAVLIIAVWLDRLRRPSTDLD